MMKLGIFLPNGQNGYIVSRASPQYVPTFAHMLAIAHQAESMGLDFLLSMIKYRGFGGATGYWDSCLDSIGLTNALAAATQRIELYATVPVLGVHPAVAARMIATLDDVSGGRAGVNIITGWNKPEYSQMGLWPSADYHDRRYEMTEEYVRIMRTLWRDGRMTHHGAFYQLDDCTCFPTTGREIPIVSAGQSPKGIRFTAEFAEYNFAFGGMEKLRGIVQPLQQQAGNFGRRVGTLALVTIIAADTDAEAEEHCSEIVAAADTDAIQHILQSASEDTNPEGTSRHLRDGLTASVEEGNLAFMGIPVIRGSHESVARQILGLQQHARIAGLLMTFPDYVRDLQSFAKHVLPYLRGSDVSPSAAA